MSSNSRTLALEGARNVRDLGGYPTASGALTRRQAYLRGDSLAHLSEADLRLLTGLGVRTVIDLREPAEAAAQPGRLLGRSGVQVHQVPLFGDLTPFGRRADDRQPVRLPTDMGALYLLCLEHGGRALRKVFELLAAGEGAVLFHCAVGKDRTGIVAALLLALAGVTRQAIVEDYLESGPNVQAMIGTWIAQYEHDPATGFHPDLLHCLPRYIEGFLDALDSRHGGAQAYLLQAGVPADALQVIRARLTA